MVYDMKLQPKYFDNMKNGTKKVELRLNDEKRRKIKLGDTIIFYKEPDLKESLKVEVIGLVVYKNFVELIDEFNIFDLTGEETTKEELLKELNKYYPEEKQNQYEALGIIYEKL